MAMHVFSLHCLRHFVVLLFDLLDDSLTGRA
jgi:hypothetical protein